MIKIKKIIIIFFFSFSFLFIQASNKKQKLVCKKINENNGPVTIFIHGTLYPLINILVRMFDLPKGLTPAKKQGNRLFHGRIAYILNKADPKQFDLDNFYFFGWSGSLSARARKKAACQLYEYIKEFKNRPITLIGHSHGGNVALLLEEVIKEKCVKDEFIKNIHIEKVILLACPVMITTQDYIKSNIFKKVISLYSTGDRTQNRDPQIFSINAHKYAKENNVHIPFFSKRIFKPSANLIQRRVLYDNRNLQHLDFVYKPFLSRLPATIKLIEKSVTEGYRNKKNVQYIINIPRGYKFKPELLVKYNKSCAQKVFNNKNSCNKCNKKRYKYYSKITC